LICDISPANRLPEAKANGNRQHVGVL